MSAAGAARRAQPETKSASVQSLIASGINNTPVRKHLNLLRFCGIMMQQLSSIFVEREGAGFAKVRLRPFRLLLAVLGVFAFLVLLSSRNPSRIPYRGYTPLNKPVNVKTYPPTDPQTGRANATFVVLARNSDLNGIEQSMREVETSFNHEHNYPWTFLNEIPFDLEFKRKVRSWTKGEVHFGLISNAQWYPPEWIDEEKYEHDRLEMQKERVPYAGSASYRNMCRFNSGYFYRQPVLDQFKWYWRVEPNVKFPCKIPYDPFVYMIENNKRYAFTISLPEYMQTIPTLWDHTKSFISGNSELLPDGNAFDWLTDDGGNSYNGCHFWSNFEIGDLDFFRSKQYSTYFNHLDEAGGFYYERWGDAPVHSIGAALLLPASQIHYFHDIGYYHGPFWNCPEEPLNSQLQCTCQREQAFNSKGARCFEKFMKLAANSSQA